MGINCNINVRSLHSRTLVLHNADSYPLNVQNRAIRKDRLIRRHGYARLYRLGGRCGFRGLSLEDIAAPPACIGWPLAVIP